MSKAAQLEAIFKTMNISGVGIAQNEFQFIEDGKIIPVRFREFPAEPEVDVQPELPVEPEPIVEEKPKRKRATKKKAE
jgi:hypothetical protein